MLTKQLSEKLTLLGSLLAASSALYDVGIDRIEQSIEAVREVGEDRNAIIHGFLRMASHGVAAFHNRGRDVQATLDCLRNLTESCQHATSGLMTNFSEFYGELARKKPFHPGIETALQNVMRSGLAQHTSLNKVRQGVLELRSAEAALAQSKRAVEESSKQLEVAKANLRNARARERRKKKAGISSDS